MEKGPGLARTQKELKRKGRRRMKVCERTKQREDERGTGRNYRVRKM
jgi:hypothetical protein